MTDTVNSEMSAAPRASEQAPAAAVPAGQNRFPGVDAVRGLAIVGVVWIHTVARTPLQHWNVLGRFGAEFFVAVSAFFLVYRSSPARRRPFGPFVDNRFRRLMLPFFAWFAIYLAMVPIGGWQVIDHLWFLPFLFAGLVILWPVTHVPLADRRLRIALVAGLAVLGFLVARTDPPAPEALAVARINLAIDHAWGFVPSLFWGAALGAALQGISPARIMRPSNALAGAALLVSAIAVLLFWGPPMDPLYRNAAAVGAVLLAVGLRRNLSFAGLDTIGRAAYGVYLAHPAIIVLAHYCRGPDRPPFGNLAIVTIGAISLVISLALTAAIRQSAWSAWLIPSGDAPIQASPTPAPAPPASATARELVSPSA